ncbi:helix-turn-helix domain-containing protein [Nocardioides sp. MAH-18]|uniref:Helix-turn-helix domain-containing protein n=1 Tax=Nocardioides agri TaxID=2682843 RepID=A0A6L6Y186_9ACTN|nr:MULTISPECIES: helix-turn-helix transcriptional regulator [unclassified Nocardioides]MBA2952159.1 helix-turn-helix transcriptional regulator [Nocardioides sp. CGMCC 1.13656]MVQ51325.1 helix-turn-helix domain-containing protein [Nocardioides sp. MAH-18]
MKLTNRQLLKALVGDHEGAKMSQRKLARYAGKHPSFINHLTSGRRKSCEPRTAELIVEALDVPLHVLFVPEQASTASRTGKEQVA